MNFSFLHAADLHLGSPFTGLADCDDELARRVRAASREAMEDLVAKAIDLKVDFLVIAGDVYDGDWKDTTIGHFFNREMSRLNRAGIPVYLVKGNHDAESIVTKSVTLPDSVRVFGSQSAVSFTIPDLKVALHGRSFADRAVLENLSVSYPAEVPGWFNIGVLHTSCTGREGHENYAPCSVEDLLQRGYQYWALGHVHTYEELNINPPIIFPGNLQGRNVRECGAKGAVLVQVEDGEIVKLSRLPLERVRWASIVADLTDAATENEAFEIVREAIQKEVDASGETPIVYRMTLEGATPLHRTLVSDPARARDEVVAAASHCRDLIWLESLKLSTTEPVSLQAAEDEALAVIDLDAMLTPLMNSPDVLREASDALALLRSKFPATTFPADLADEAVLTHLLMEAREALLSSELKAD